MYIDASEAFWILVASQTGEDGLVNRIRQQRHELLAFLDGKFTGAQKHWTTYEKEAFPTVQIFDRLDYSL